MFGMMEALISFVRRQVGLRTDAASASGSLHAKLKNVVDNAIPTLQKPRALQGAPGSFITVETTYQTALDITGRGRLIALGLERTALGRQYVKVTIDGTLVAAGRGDIPAGGGWVYPIGKFILNTDDSDVGFASVEEGGSALVDLSFKTSLKIETHGTDNGLYIHWQYELE